MLISVLASNFLKSGKGVLILRFVKSNGQWVQS